MTLSSPENSLNQPPYFEKIVNSTDILGCIDGRPDEEATDIGIQMLGGTLNMIVLKAIYKLEEINAELITSVTDTLRGNNQPIGIHRAQSHQQEHSEKVTSGCGFADRLADILISATTNKDYICTKLSSFLGANTDKLESFGHDFQANLEQAFSNLEQYNSRYNYNTKPQIYGNELIAQIERLEGAKVTK